jgi:hypothetical protein
MTYIGGHRGDAAWPWVPRASPTACRPGKPLAPPIEAEEWSAK